MSTDTANKSNPAFVKAFLPGLVLGLVVGGLAGAFLPPMLSGGESFSVPPASGTGATKSGGDSRQRELDALKKGSPEAQPAPSEVKPAEPPATDPAKAAAPKEDPKKADPTKPAEAAPK